MAKIRRIIALLTVVIVIALVIATFVCGVTGSEYFFGVLFLTFVVPVVLWVFMWFTNLISPKADESSANDEDEEEE